MYLLGKEAGSFQAILKLPQLAEHIQVKHSQGLQLEVVGLEGEVLGQGSKNQDLDLILWIKRWLFSPPDSELNKAPGETADNPQEGSRESSPARESQVIASARGCTQ